MTQRELFKETFSQLHASPDTLSEVMNMAKHENITYMNKTKRRPARKLIAIVAVAALLVTGAFAAGTAIYRMNSEPIGEYGLSLMVDFENTAPSVEVGQTPVLDIAPRWLPEGMALNPGETMKYSYEETPWQGGFSMRTAVMNTGEETFCETITNLKSRESLTVSDHEAVYVTLLTLESDSLRFNRRLYVSYPEYNQVLCIYIGEDMDKDTAVKFAENLVFTETGEYLPEEVIKYHTELYREAKKTARTAEAPDGDEDAIGPAEKMTATAAEMENLHQIGESFIYETLPNGLLEVAVTDVTVGCDAGIFGEGFENSDLAAKLDENGKPPMNVIQFVKQGDGINAVDAISAEKEEATKLVSVTFAVTNHTDAVQEHVHFYACLLPLVETVDGYAVWEPVPDSNVDYDYVSMSKVPGDHRMLYHSVTDNSTNGGNYIPSIAPGETVDVQVGFLVNESELDKLYLNLDGGGNGFSFHEAALAMGYVDIRQ